MTACACPAPHIKEIRAGLLNGVNQGLRFFVVKLIALPQQGCNLIGMVAPRVLNHITRELCADF